MQKPICLASLKMLVTLTYLVAWDWITCWMRQLASLSWLKPIFCHLSREQESKSALGLWRAVERYIGQHPERIDTPVLQEVAD